MKLIPNKEGLLALVGHCRDLEAEPSHWVMNQYSWRTICKSFMNESPRNEIQDPSINRTLFGISIEFEDLPNNRVCLKSGQNTVGCMTLEDQRDHVLYKTGDVDAPDSIKDRNGEVVLDLCRRCGRGESELSEPCLK